MKAYLVRHAKAGKRGGWDGPDELRGLTDDGWTQAFDLVESLRGVPVGRLLSSPFLRCRQTLQPLADARRLEIEVESRLGEGTPLERVLQLLDDHRAWPTVFCSHGDVIPDVLGRLAAGGVRAWPARCAKGSVWLLEGETRPTRARYLAPRSDPCGELDRARPAGPPFSPAARVAVLDLGSTSFHLAVFDVSAENAIERVSHERVMLRLGSSLARSTHIPDDVVARAIDAAEQLRGTAERAGAECLMPVATSAIRDADNGPMLADAIAEVVRAPVRVLSGQTEGRLIFAALRRRLGIGSERVLGVDLGGGSLELVAGTADELAVEATLPLGVARLHGAVVGHDPIAASELAAIFAEVDARLEPRLAELEPFAAGLCVATGGTVGALARLLAASPEHPERRAQAGDFLTRSALEELCHSLTNATQDERLALAGISPRRADLLPVGAAVMLRLAERLGIERFVFSNWALREGVALESVGLGAPPTRRPVQEGARGEDGLRSSETVRGR